MAIDVNELILDKVRSLDLTSLTDGSVIGQLTKLENPSLQTTSDADEVTDNVGSLITKIFRAKTGRFEATNSLLSLDLLAQQYGTTKEVASDTNKIVVPAYEELEIVDGKVTLSHEPKEALKYIYLKNKGALATKYTVDTAASATTFSIDGAEITTPTGVTGKLYIPYKYETTSAIRIKNNTENFPEAVGATIYSIFRDQCNENIKYAGVVEAAKGKIDASDLSLDLTSTGKHPFAIDFMKDYCDDDADLFTVYVAE